jgi:hypothetical protein
MGSGSSHRRSERSRIVAGVGVHGMPDAVPEVPVGAVASLGPGPSTEAVGVSGYPVVASGAVDTTVGARSVVSEISAPGPPGHGSGASCGDREVGGGGLTEEDGGVSSTGAATEVHECPVCLDDISVQDSAMRCAGEGGIEHYFHAECLAEWSRTQKWQLSHPTCPVCRG